jgi:hypothetical protein
MKKLLLSGLVIACTSCGSGRLVRQSDVCITNTVKTKVWFKNNSTGEYLYRSWKAGTYGNRAQVFLVDSTEFSALIKKSL